MDRYGMAVEGDALYRGGEQRSKVTMYKTLVQRRQLWLFVSVLRFSCTPELPDASVFPSTSSQQVSTLSVSSATSEGCIARPPAGGEDDDSPEGERSEKVEKKFAIADISGTFLIGVGGRWGGGEENGTERPLRGLGATAWAIGPEKRDRHGDEDTAAGLASSAGEKATPGCQGTL